MLPQLRQKRKATALLGAERLGEIEGSMDANDKVTLKYPLVISVAM